MPCFIKFAILSFLSLIAESLGIGRYGGMASIDSFTTTRWITVDQGQRKYPPPFVEK